MKLLPSETVRLPARLLVSQLGELHPEAGRLEIEMPVHTKEITQAFMLEFLSHARYDRNDGQFYWTRRPNSKVTPGSKCGAIGKGYTWISFKGKKFALHRLAWTLLYGEIPIGLQIDHIDGNRMNNHASNLRLVTHAENLQNRRTAITRSKSGLLGVVQCTRSGAWVAQIKINKVQTRLGTYRTKEDAYTAYVEAKRMHHPKSTL